MNILNQIINETRKTVEEQKLKYPLEKVRELAEQQVTKAEPHRFYKALDSPQIGIIAEVKRASPSKGVICRNFDPVLIADEYGKGGANAISVLTEEKYFQGSITYLSQIAQKVSLPILRKDFIIDNYQIYEAAVNSASAVLLIVAALSEEQIRDYLNLIHTLKMDALVEVHNHNELEKALKTGANIIGINNRDLKTFKTNLQTSIDLVKAIPNGILKVSESGIKSRKDVIQLQDAGFDAVLVGEILMRQTDRTAFLHKLRGESCG